MNTFIKALLIAILPFSAWANEHDVSKDVSAFIQTMQQQDIFNGSLAIIEGGEVVYNNSVGFTNFDKSIALENTTVFNIGSISKDFTAMSILLLLEENKLTLQDPLSHYFPELPSWANKVEITHLLSHSSGLPAMAYIEGLENRQVLTKLNEVSELEFSPDDKTLYGSFGYQLLAMIVAKVSKQSFGDFVASRIFTPLDMKYSYVLGTHPAKKAQLAIGYEFGRGSVPQDSTTGAGNVYSNVSDLVKWERALFNNILIEDATLQNALEPFKCWGNDCRLKADFGVGVYKDDELWGIHHHGGFGGYQAMLYRFPKQNRAIIFTANNGLELQYNDIRYTLMSILNGENPAYPKKDAHILYYDALINKGFESAKSAYLSMSKETDRYDVNESDMNSIGYFLLGDNKAELAVKTFKFCTEQFSDSPNIWDSYGEALEVTNDAQGARSAYKKALELAKAESNEELVESVRKNLARVK